VLASRLAPYVRPVLINGVAGAVAVRDGELLAVLSFTVKAGKIATMDVLNDPARLATLDLTVLD